MKVRSEKTVQRLTDKLNKRFDCLNECPRCGNGYDLVGDYQFEGEGVSFMQECHDCGIMVTHHFDWVESEVTLLEK